nr:MAG TPA: hypothetical protein [Caudoviricetes sp.]
MGLDSYIPQSTLCQTILHISQKTTCFFEIFLL